MAFKVKQSSTLLYLTLPVIGGVGYYYYSSNCKPNYKKISNEIRTILDSNPDYDGIGH
jgi:hypothetical protein